KTGGPVAAVSSDKPATRLALDGQFVYFTSGFGDGGVYRVPKSGGALDRTYAAGLGATGDLLLDGTSVYFIVPSGSTGSVQKGGTSGGSSQTLRSGLKHPDSLVSGRCEVFVSHEEGLDRIGS